MKKIVLIIGMISLFLFLTGCNNNQYDSLAQCLTDSGAKMYGAEWCGHCQSQKELFGDSFEYITFVDAVYEPELASSYGVPGYPTWVLADGTFLIGKQSIETLMEKSEYNG